jgi:hypothetical protein
MQLVDATIAAIPLWLLFPLLVALFLLCCVAGAKLRRRLANEPDERAPDSYILSAVLGLLGLMIAFTFSMALSRYDERREIVVSEANAIGTAWLRAGLIEGAGGAALQNSLTHYAELRSRLPHEGETEAVERETAEAQRQLWAQMRQSLGATPAADLRHAHQRNERDVRHSRPARKAEREAHIPGAVVEILLLYALLSAGIVGYVLGASEARHRGITFVLFVLLTLSLVLILDLDRPWRGGVTVSQQPMADLVAGLKTRS